MGQGSLAVRLKNGAMGSGCVGASQGTFWVNPSSYVKQVLLPVGRLVQLQGLSKTSFMYWWLESEGEKVFMPSGEMLTGSGEASDGAVVNKVAMIASRMFLVEISVSMGVFVRASVGSCQCEWTVPRAGLTWAA